MWEMSQLLDKSQKHHSILRKGCSAYVSCDSGRAALCDQPITCHGLQQRLACVWWECRLKLQLLGAAVRKGAGVTWHTLVAVIVGTQLYHNLQCVTWLRCKQAGSNRDNKMNETAGWAYPSKHALVTSETCFDQQACCHQKNRQQCVHHQCCSMKQLLARERRVERCFVSKLPDGVHICNLSLSPCKWRRVL